MSPNFTFLDPCRPDVARLVAAMVQARDAAERRSWSHPQEPTGEEWWADVLADPRARKRERRRTDLAVRQAFYRLADEKREIILVACSKCDWRAAFSRDDLIATHGAHYAMPNLLNQLAYHEGCNSAGGDVLVEGRNLTIEYRWAEGRSERFAEIAAEFVRLQGRCYCYAQHSPAARGQAGDIGDPDRGLATARPRSARRSGQSLDKGGGPLGL